MSHEPRIISRVLEENGDYWFDLPVHSEAAFALGEDRLITIFKQTVGEQVSRMAEDAVRYRWLLKTMQARYDGETSDDYTIDITCSMQYGRRAVRRVQAVISWFDERDEQLNLSAAIDAAMKA